MSGNRSRCHKGNHRKISCEKRAAGKELNLAFLNLLLPELLHQFSQWDFKQMQSCSLPEADSAEKHISVMLTGERFPLQEMSSFWITRRKWRKNMGPSPLCDLIIRWLRSTATPSGEEHKQCKPQVCTSATMKNILQRNTIVQVKLN